MAPAVRLFALGIRFTKKELTELEKVWNDGAWDDDEHELDIGEEIIQGPYENNLEPESECEEYEDDDEDDEEEEEEEDGEEEEEKECSKGEEAEQDNETRDGSPEDDFARAGEGYDEGSRWHISRPLTHPVSPQPPTEPILPSDCVWRRFKTWLHASNP